MGLRKLGTFAFAMTHTACQNNTDQCGSFFLNDVQQDYRYALFR